jgi:hypothetical protein
MWDERLVDNKFNDDRNPSPTASLQESNRTNSEVHSETPLNGKEKKTNRIWPTVKYAVQQKGFTIFSLTAIVLSISAALAYLQDKAQFVAFFFFCKQPSLCYYTNSCNCFIACN